MSCPLSRKAVTQREMVGIETPTSSASFGVEYLPVRIRRITWSSRFSISKERSYNMPLPPSRFTFIYRALIDLSRLVDHTQGDLAESGLQHLPFGKNGLASISTERGSPNIWRR